MNAVKKALALAAVLVLTAPAVASADSTLNGSLTGGSLTLGTLAPFALGPDQIKISGPIGDDGAVNIPASGITFQPISTPVNVSGLSLNVTIALSATGPATGNIPLSGGAATLTVPAQANIEALPLLSAAQGCNVGPITFQMTGTYDAATKRLKVGQPNVSVPAVGQSCGALGGIVNSQLGLPSSNNAVSLDFVVDAVQAAVASATVGKVSGTLVKNAVTVPLTCKGPDEADGCLGQLRLITKVKGKTVQLGKIAYDLAPGEKGSLKLKPSASGKKKITGAGKKGLKGALEIWPKGAKKASATKALTLKGGAK